MRPLGSLEPLEPVVPALALERNGDSKIVLGLAEQLSSADGPEIIAVHVFSPDQLPPFVDGPIFEAEAWAREFLRHVSGEAAAHVHVDLRVGDPAGQGSTAVRDLDAHLVVLAPQRDLSDGHARIVRRVLETAAVPLVLLDPRKADIPVGAARQRTP